MIGAALVLALAMQDAVEVPAPRRARTVQSSVRILIEESPQGEYPHDYYEQPFPSQVRTGSTLLGSEVWYKTLCRPQDEDRRPLFVPPPEPPLPLTVSGVLGSPQISIGDGGATLIGGNPRRDPGSSGTRTAKAAIFSGGSSDSGSSDTDSPFLYGTDLDYVVAPDVTGWSPLRWLPEETSFHLYGRALFGSLEIFDVSTDIQLYGVGPRLGVPIARGDGVRLEGTISAGPAFLHTGIGDAVGFDGGVGLSFSLILSRGLSLIVEIEANLYLSDHVTAFGPVLNLGFNLAW